MRLLLVHGIAQEGRVQQELMRDWLDWLAVSVRDRKVLDAATVEMPYYGNDLAQLTAGAGTSAIAQGTGNLDAGEALFMADTLEEMAGSLSVSTQEINAEQRKLASELGTVVEQWTVMGKRVNAVARVLERVSPLRGGVILSFVRQAYAYLKSPGVAPVIDGIVRPSLEAKGQVVVVAHSLGTVVAFKLMRQIAAVQGPVECPLFMTLGSPLPLRSVSRILGGPFGAPQGVQRWVNALDPRDTVTLGKKLDAVNFWNGIENIDDITNGFKDNPHHVSGYLKDPRVGAMVEHALRPTP